jgi:ABC-type transporter Mla maintaining outer membrane lipid asymmetry ATPase subunit MlaF
MLCEIEAVKAKLSTATACLVWIRDGGYLTEWRQAQARRALKEIDMSESNPWCKKMHPLPHDKGDIEVLGKRWRDLDARAKQALRGEIGMLFQGAALFDSMTIRENLAFPLVEGRVDQGGVKGAKAVRARVEEIAEQTSVQGILDRFPATVSNGERKRVGLARALITRPKIMVYDEPTTGQDPIMMRRVDDMIVEANERFQITSIVISHDMLSTFRIANKVALIHKGHLAAAGTPDELRACPDPRVQSFIFAGAGT